MMSARGLSLEHVRVPHEIKRFVPEFVYCSSRCGSADGDSSRIDDTHIEIRMPVLCARLRNNVSKDVSRIDIADTSFPRDAQLGRPGQRHRTGSALTYKTAQTRTLRIRIYCVTVLAPPVPPVAPPPGVPPEDPPPAAVPAAVTAAVNVATGLPVASIAPVAIN
jgi:hypothetical protein